MKEFYQIVLWTVFLSLAGCSTTGEVRKLVGADQSALIQLADQYLLQEPVPLTQFFCPRSSGGIHDFYSEGDYWWPDPDNPQGPYIRRDGQSNPENFTAHREAMRDLGRWVAALTAAYKLTRDEKYAHHALRHLQAWFVDEDTRMNPHFLYAQAIQGLVTGRGIGIIDAIHLIEVARSIQELRRLGFLADADFRNLQGWFDQFVTWLTTHPYGIDERDHGNNHSTWWAAQVAVFADLAERPELLHLCRQQFKKLLSQQFNAEGGFPDELSRTKPYNYSLFNLEAYSLLAHIASNEQDNLWTYTGAQGSLQDAWRYMFPFVADKASWPFPPDIEHFSELPIQSCGLLLAGVAYQQKSYLRTWKRLSPDRKSKEIDRTYPLRQPILWFN
ncbi:MAG: alginate lyase family protein [Lewinellaceae bacterium]|nr:alginate lyase family protein [Lewinellaceae bacterium]